MGNHKAITGGRRKLAGGMVLGAVASGALAVGSLSGAGAANATCASISGIGNSAECSSSFGSVAVAVGQDAVAHAGTPGTFSPANFAITAGATSQAFAGALPPGGQTPAPVPANIGNVSLNVGQGFNNVTTNGLANLGVSLGATDPADPLDGNLVSSTGFLNSSLNVLSRGSSVNSGGVINNATNIGGTRTFIASANQPPQGQGLLRSLRPGLNVGFNAFGSGNFVGAGAGSFSPGNHFFAIAGNALRDGQGVTRANTGVHINDLNFPNETP